MSAARVASTAAVARPLLPDAGKRPAAQVGLPPERFEAGGE